MLGCAIARSSMMLLARNRSVRLMRVTLVAKRVRKSASSMAESPPPMTAISLPDAKKPSQVAQELTPWPMSACSLGRFSQRAAGSGSDDERARVDRVLAGAEVQLVRVLAEVDGDEVRHLQLGAETGRLLLHVLDQLRPLDALGPAGKVLHQCGDGKLASGLVAFEDERLEVGAGGVDGGGESGAAGAQDDGVAGRDIRHCG